MWMVVRKKEREWEKINGLFIYTDEAHNLCLPFSFMLFGCDMVCGLAW